MESNNFKVDCFFDIDKDSDIFDDFFNNLEDANCSRYALEPFGNEQLRFKPRKLSPVIKQNDIRRSYSIQLEKILNSCDKTSLINFLGEVCSKNCEFIFPSSLVVENDANARGDQTTINSHASAADHILSQLLSLSDGLFLLHETKFLLSHDGPCFVKCKYSYRGTHLERSQFTQVTDSLTSSRSILEPNGLSSVDNAPQTSLVHDLAAFRLIYSANTGQAYSDEADIQWCRALERYHMTGFGRPSLKPLIRSPCCSPRTPLILPPPGFNKYDRRNKQLVNTLGDAVDYLRDSAAGGLGAAGGFVELSVCCSSGGSSKQQNGGGRRTKSPKISHAPTFEQRPRSNTVSSVSSDSLMAGMSIAARITTDSPLQSGFWLLSTPRLVDARGVLKMHINSDKRVVKIEMRSTV